MLYHDDQELLSGNERSFLLDSLNASPPCRADGRSLMEQRKIRFVFRRNGSQCQADVCLGDTRVLANVHAEVVTPYPDRPTEGFFKTKVDLSPLASPSYEANSYSTLSIELARFVERNIRDSRALDTESLAIVAGDKVWSIHCDIHVLSNNGNLIDAVSVGAIAALLHFRKPNVLAHHDRQSGDESDDMDATNDILRKIGYIEEEATPLSLHHIPVSISMCYILPRNDMTSKSDPHDTSEKSPVFFLDPTDREELIRDGYITFTFNSFNELCAVHKSDGAPLSMSDIMHCARAAAARADDLIKLLKCEEEIANIKATNKRRAALRGQKFADVSSAQATKVDSDVVGEVQMGDLTDYRKLHAPVALRDDTATATATVANDKKPTTMEELIRSLETTSSFIDDAQATSGGNKASISGGLVLSAKARSKYQELVQNVTTTSMSHEGSKQAESSSEEDDEQVLLQSEFCLESKAVGATDKTLMDEDSSDDDDDLMAALKK